MEVGTPGEGRIPPATEAGTAAEPLRALSLRACLTSSGAIPLAIALAVFGMFLSVLVEPYAFADDHSILWMADTGIPSPQFGKNILDAAASEGRPFVGLFDQLFFSAAGTVDNLRFVRMIGVIGIAALALLLFWALARSGIRRTPAALMAVLVSSLPAFQVFGSWAVLSSSPYAAFLGGGASMLATAAIDAPRDLVKDRTLGATAMLIGALLTYQPGAMFFWVFLAVALVGAVDDSERAWRLVRLHFAVGGVALALWYLILKASIHLIGKDANGGNRSTLTHDLVGKARWFLGQPLYRSLNLFDLTPSLWFAALVAAVAAGGILLWLVRRGARPVLYIVVGLILIPLCYLPNLAVRDNWAPYRTQVSISSLIALYLCFGAIALWLSVRDWLRRRVSRNALAAGELLALACSAAFVAVSVFFAAKNVTTLIVEPHVTEQRLLRSQVAALPAGVQRIAFVETSWYLGLTTQVVYDEFGLATSVRPWALEPSVDLILREEGRLPPHQPGPIVDVYAPETSTLPSDEPVIDLRGELQRLR